MLLPLLLAVFALWLLWWLLTQALPLWRNNRAYRAKEARLREQTAAANGGGQLADALLCHVNYRITAMLHAAYPNARWEWLADKPSRFAVEGGMARIRVYGIPDFDYADVKLVLGGKRRRFLVSAGMGFDAAVCHEVCISKWKKILNRLKLGKLSYAVVALNRLLKDQPVRMEIRLDDGSVHRFECAYFAAFMNQKYEGGGFKFCPEASPSDGKLDIMVAADLSKKKILCLLPTAFFGKHTKFRGVTILQCRSAEVSTGSTLPIHTDGEPIFLRNEMKVRLMEEKIRFITE